MEALSGQYGIWPWYRPLSRELFFKLVVAAGPASLPLAHALGLACAFMCAWLLWRVGRRLAGDAAAAVAALIFLSYGYTKYLASWASGFQDLLPLLLILVALDAHLRKRHTVALLVATLAAFAKESGFLAFPLLIACAFLCGDERPGRGWVARLIAAGAVAIAIHAAVRFTWHTAGGTIRTAAVVERLPTILGYMLEGFVSRPAPGKWSLALAALAGVGAVLLISARPTPAAKHPPGPERSLAGGTTFTAIAAALGLAPVIAAHVLHLTYANGYQAFPAVPWIALLFAQAVTRLPAPLWRTAVPLLVAWNVWALGFKPPDLEQRASWQLHRQDWNWHEAVRLTAVLERLQADVRQQLAVRPESLVVLYEWMPPDCLFQTEDGPATREALDDRTVRAYWVNEPPADVRGDRLAILTFDLERLHLERAPSTDAAAVTRAISAVMARRGDLADVFARYGESPNSARFDRAYVRAAAALLEEGPAGFVRGLARAGLADTLGPTPAELAEPLAAIDPALGSAFVAALRRPSSAAAHAALAETLLARRVLPRAGLELRIAVTLDPARHGDRYRLAQVMVELGGTKEALAELSEMARDPSAGTAAYQAHQLFERLERGDSLARRRHP